MHSVYAGVVDWLDLFFDSKQKQTLNFHNIIIAHSVNFNHTFNF